MGNMCIALALGHRESACALLSLFHALNLEALLAQEGR